MMTRCEDEQALIWDEKDPDDTDAFYVNFERACARTWTHHTDLAAGTRIRVYDSTLASGFEHEYSGGRTGSKYPRFKTVLAEVSLADGSGTWTARAITTASLYRTISGTPTWTPDDGITAGTPSISSLVANCALSGGEDGTDYTVLVQATFSDGSTLTATCTLPVRRPESVCE